MKNKKAMTLSEVLISLAVVGILAMILVPLLTKTTANKERFLYKKAVNTMQNAVAAVMNENGVVNSANFWPELTNETTGENLRKAIAKKIVTLQGASNSEGTGIESPDFVSNDGMIWWGLPDHWPEDQNYIDVNVDVNGQKGTNLASSEAGVYGETNLKPDQFRIRIMKDGRVMIPMYYDEERQGANGEGEDTWSFESEYWTSQKSSN